MKLLETARLTAKELHQGTNHYYDGKDYFETHIEAVVAFGKQFSYLIPLNMLEIVLIALYLHDAIEDCRITYGDALKWFGKEVAEIVFALSNEKGKTRKDRANAKYYKGIRKVKFATFCKLADRLANVTYSQEKGSTMYTKYKEEHPNFVKSLKGTHTFFGRTRYFLKSLFRMHEADYSAMYGELDVLFMNAPAKFLIDYTEA